MRYRLSFKAEAQLDDIWLFIARESGSIDTANRIVRNVSETWALSVACGAFANKKTLRDNDRQSQESGA